LLGALGEDLRVDYLSLAIKLPSSEQVALWIWFSPKFRDYLEKDDYAAFKIIDLQKMPEGYSLYRGLSSPLLLTNLKPGDSIISHVFSSGIEVVSATDVQEEVKNSYEQIVPGLGETYAFVPIFFQGAVVGVFDMETIEKRRIVPSSVRRLKYSSRLLAGMIHSRRQMYALTKLTERLDHYGKTTTGSRELLINITSEIHRYLEPVATCFMFNRGFKRFWISINGNQEPAVHELESMGMESLKDIETYLETVTENGSSKYRVDEQILRVPLKEGDEESVRLGILLLVSRRVDIVNQPSLARARLLRQSVGTVANNTILQGVSNIVANKLAEITKGYASKAPGTIQEWFSVLHNPLIESGMLWVGFSDQDQEDGFIGIDQEVEQQFFSHLGTVGRLENIQIIKLGEEPHRGAGSVICLDLGDESRLWLGLEPSSFEPDLVFRHSPWKTFLVSLREIVSKELSRIKLFNREQLISKMELQAQHDLAKNLLVHEMGNMANMIRSGADLALDELHLENFEEIPKILGDVSDFASSFSTIAKRLNKPFRLKDERNFYPLDEMIDAIHKYYGVVFESRKIQVLYEGNPEQVVSLPFTVLYMALTNLIMNSVKALKKEGTIRIYTDNGEKGLLCHVVDSGPGVAAQLKDKLFKEGSSADSEKQAGFGLCGSRRLLRSHGGDLVYHDTEKGAHFTLELPSTDNASTEN